MTIWKLYYDNCLTFQVLYLFIDEGSRIRAVVFRCSVCREYFKIKKYKFLQAMQGVLRYNGMKTACNKLDKTVSEKWMTSFPDHLNLCDLLKLVEFILSILEWNAFVERVFSVTVNKWTGVRKRCYVQLIESELLISINSPISCELFSQRIKSLLTKCNCKYSWKKAKALPANGLEQGSANF